MNSFDSLKIEIVLPLASFMGLISEQNISDASSKNEMQNHHVKHMSKIHLIAYKIDFLIRLHCNESISNKTIITVTILIRL